MTKAVNPKIEMRKITEIHPYAQNPRCNDHVVEELASFIKKVGFRGAIEIDTHDVIINGHLRYKAAMFLGLEEIPVIVRDDLTDDEIMAYRIADNKTAEAATWDYEALKYELQDLMAAEFDVSSLGFANDLIADLLSDNDETLFDGETNPDNIPERDYSIPPDSTIDTIYALGEHRLYCGTTSIAAAQRLLEGTKADLYLAHFTEWKKTTALQIEIAAANLIPGGSFYIMYDDALTLLLRQSCRRNDLDVHNVLLWPQSAYLPGKYYDPQTLSVMYGWRNATTHNWYSDQKQTNILQYENAPFGVPVAMSVYFICNSTQKGDVVFDNASLQGNSIIACEQTGRRCFMTIDDPVNADIIRKRWAEFVKGEGCNWQELTPKINGENDGKNKRRKSA